MIKKERISCLKRQMRHSKFKKQLYAVGEQVNVAKHLKVPTRCPYCGGRMIIKTIGDYDPKSHRADELLCVCEHYDDTCSCSVKLKRSFSGELVPIGIPADDQLKSLRREAHFYMEYLIKFRIVQSEDDAYRLLSDELGIHRTQMHISMLMEGRCQEAILKILKILAAHADKTSFKIWIYQPQRPGIQTFSSTNAEAIELLEKMHARIYKK